MRDVSSTCPGAFSGGSVRVSAPERPMASTSSALSQMSSQPSCVANQRWTAARSASDSRPMDVAIRRSSDSSVAAPSTETKYTPNGY
ncbi:MAG: hypothetical protein ACK56I_07595, partial [bacterium]